MNLPDPLSLSNFLESALESNWIIPKASSRPAEADNMSHVLGQLSSDVVRSDYAIVIARWCAHRFYWTQPGQRVTRLEVSFGVKDKVVESYPDAKPEDRKQLIEFLAEIIWNLRDTGERSRQKWDLSKKQDLITRDGCHCAICGFNFPSENLDYFLGVPTSLASSRQFVDFLKPLAKGVQEMSIEIDHINPLARGGKDDIENLQLLCSFCNRRKRELLSIFDVGYKKPQAYKHPNTSVGVISYPHPFHVVRTLTGGFCTNCKRTASETELTVTKLQMCGEANPLNLAVTCYDCDPISSVRFVRTEDFLEDEPMEARKI